MALVDFMEHSILEGLWPATGNYPSTKQRKLCDYWSCEQCKQSFDRSRNILLIMATSACGCTGVLRVATKFIVHRLPGLLAHTAIIAPLLQHFLEEHVKINCNRKPFVSITMINRLPWEREKAIWNGAYFVWNQALEAAQSECSSLP